jgi:hypothetical protein
MANKKQKRSVSSTVTPLEKATVARAHGRTGTAEFKPDYSYVRQDLKRIGILAGSFFVILVVLSFFLR